jgi:uncharacterized protein
MISKRQMVYSLAAIFIMATFANCFADNTEFFPKLTLSAEALIHKPADELRMTIGVVNIGDTAEIALEENSKKMQDVIRSIETAGLNKTEYETGRFSIEPTYTPTPKNPPSDWKPSIIGYKVTNTIQVKTGQLSQAGRLIDVTNKAGANSVENIHFTLHDPRSYRDEVIKSATTNAMQDAKIIASAAGIKLLRLLSVDLDHAQLVMPRANNIYFAKAMAADSSPPIEAGNVDITARISLSYEISN